MNDFEITKDEHGTYVAVGDDCRLAVLPDGPSRIFRRRAIKSGPEGSSEVCWLVGELNGVRLYKDGNNLVMTTQDISP